MAKQSTPDFRGIATAYGVKCSDGRTIKHGAFNHQDGITVPMIWRHKHDELRNVVGNVKLMAHEVGMKVEAFFNRTQAGRDAREMVRNGDLRFLSVWANNIVEDAQKLVHKGDIKEVSLVLAGANPGATIEEVLIHSQDPFENDVVLEGSYIIHSGEPIELVEEESEETEAPEESEELTHEEQIQTVKSILVTFTEEEKKVLGFVLEHSLYGNMDQELVEGDGKTIKDVYDALTEEKMNALHYVAGAAAETKEDKPEDKVEHSELTGENLDMETVTEKKVHNVFESDTGAQKTQVVISHDEMGALVGDAMRAGVKLSKVVNQSIIQHAGTYGIDSIDVLFPEAKNVESGAPRWVAREMSWVSKVMGGVRHVPFNRIKSRYATITEDEARARGYITAAEKFEQVFEVFKRETLPTTIYIKQKMDKDEVDDITDFDVINWIKSMMQNLLREEAARAMLVGDGRDPVADAADKIDETKIRPIWTDSDVYSHKYVIPAADDVLDLIDHVVKAQEFYQGAGNPTLFVPKGLLTSMLVVRDADNRRMHNSVAEIAGAMMVNEIVEVEIMTGLTRDVGDDTHSLMGILVNLDDYVVGATKGGKTSYFDQFDIDFNQFKYLYESRMCGALTVPKSAVILEQTDAVV
jgi:HK97 family phage prohead protease